MEPLARAVRRHEGAKRLRELELDNGRLKKLLAEAKVDKAMVMKVITDCLDADIATCEQLVDCAPVELARRCKQPVAERTAAKLRAARASASVVTVEPGTDRSTSE